MGAHHFKVDFVPPGMVPARDEEGLYDGAFLKNFSIPEQIVQRLRQIFTNPNHWGHVEEYCSANPWGSDLRICHDDDGRIEEVTFRYAPVADPIEKLREFVNIANDAGCYLLLGSPRAVMAPEFEEVLKALKAHHSYKFISDPKSAVIEASEEVNELLDIPHRNRILNDLDDSKGR